MQPNPQIPTDAGITVTATTSYSGYPAARLIDGDITTSWYADSTCASLGGVICCNAETIRVDLAAARTISGVVIRGNQDGFSSGYDILSGTVELLSANGAVLATRRAVMNRPDGDWATIFSPAIANVRAVRFVPGVADSSAAGFAELQLFGP